MQTVCDLNDPLPRSGGGWQISLQEGSHGVAPCHLSSCTQWSSLLPCVLLLESFSILTTALIWLMQPSKAFHRNQPWDALECVNLTLSSYRWSFVVRRVKNVTSYCWIFLELHTVGNMIPGNAFVFSLASKSLIIYGFLCHLCIKMLKKKGQASAVIIIQSQIKTQECQDFLVLI